jgi:hypothetical protein
MQRIRLNLLSLLQIGYETAALPRVGATSTTAFTSLPLVLVRQHSTETAKQISKLDKSDPNYLQHVKRLLRPQNSGRNQFERKWQKQLQIKVSGPSWVASIGWRGQGLLQGLAALATATGVLFAAGVLGTTYYWGGQGCTSAHGFYHGGVVGANLGRHVFS